MSLKAFHVFFVAICLVFAVGIGLWGLREFQMTGDRSALYLCVGSFVGVVVLSAYGLWFLKKLRNFSYV